MNNMREGALDKVVYEAAATCMPVLASNHGFADVLPPELRFRPRRRRRSWPRSCARSRTPTATRSVASCAPGSRRATRSSTGPTRCWRWLDDDRPPRPEGRRHLRLRGAPALVAARPEAARLGHPLPDAARERARRLGLRARARGGRRASGCDPDAHRRRPGHVRPRPHVPASRTARRSCTRTSSTPTPTARPRARSRRCRSGSRRSTASTSSAKDVCSRSATARSARSPTARSRSRAASPATSPRPRASPSRTSRSSTTGSRQARSRSRTRASAPRFLCVGRLIPIKGHVVLLRAFRRVLDERPDARLDIAGRGVLEHGLKDLARELGLADAVRFLGHVTPVQRAIEQSLAVVVPSLGEGFGMVALEAMERGAAGDRRLDRRARGPRPRGRDGPARRRPATPTQLAEAMLAARERPRSARRRWAARRASARSSASRRTAAPSGPRRSTATGSTGGAPRELEPASGTAHLAIAAAASSASTKSQGTR